jgi:tetratricopeptide (TPR) repeat protein
MDGSGPADPRKIADLGVLATAQTAAQQAWVVAVMADGKASAIAAWEEYFRRARELLQVARWFEQRWPPVMPLTELAGPLVHALRQRADYAAAAADVERARTYRDEAQDLERRFLDPVAAAVVRRARALDDAMQGRFHEALVELFDIQTVFAAAGRPLELALTVQQLASLYEWLGDYGRALEVLESVRKCTADRMAAAPQTAEGVQDAIVRQMAAIASGAPHGGEGLDALQLRRIAGELVQAEGRIRRQLGEWDAARRLLIEARLYVEEVGLGLAVDYHLAAVATASGELDEAEALLQRVEPGFVGLVRPRLASLRVVQADVELARGRLARGRAARGRLARALELADEGLQDLRTYPDEDAAWRLHLRRGRALVALDRRRDALAAYSEGAEVVDALRRGSLGYRLDSTYFTDKLPLFAEAVDLACVLDDGVAAARLVEQAKARALSATISIPAAERGPRSLDESRFDEVCQRLEGLEFAAYCGADSEATRVERRQLSEERDAVLERLRIADPRWRGLSHPASIDVPAVLARLADGDRAALTLFHHDDVIVAILLHNGAAQVAMHRPAPETLAALGEYVVNLRSAHPCPPLFDASGAGGLTIESLVPAELASAAVQAGTLIVVPHGALHVLPWAGLTLNGRRLFELTNVGVLPSLSCVSLLDHIDGGPPRAVLLGDPDYTGLQGFDPLPEVSAELQDVARLYGADLLVPPVTGSDADERSFWRLADLPGARDAVLHIACHATLEAASPLQSGLLLTRSKVDAAEIALARRPWAEVVLSACSTGWRPQRVGPIDLAGDDSLGLTASFLEAGSRFVLVSVPPVEDRAARAFTVAWHRHRRRGKSPLTAATLTQRDLLRSGAHEPWSWVGIQAYGCR